MTITKRPKLTPEYPRDIYEFLNWWEKKSNQIILENGYPPLEKWENEFKEIKREFLNNNQDIKDVYYAAKILFGISELRHSIDNGKDAAEVAYATVGLMWTISNSRLDRHEVAIDKRQDKLEQIDTLAEVNRASGSNRLKYLQGTINMLAEENPTWNLTKLRKETAKRVKKSNGQPYSASYLQKMGLKPTK